MKNIENIWPPKRPKPVASQNHLSNTAIIQIHTPSSEASGHSPRVYISDKFPKEFFFNNLTSMICELAFGNH